MCVSVCVGRWVSLCVCLCLCVCMCANVCVCVCMELIIVVFVFEKIDEAQVVGDIIVGVV